MNIEAWNAKQLEKTALPEDCALLQFADGEDLFVAPVRAADAELRIVGHDIDDENEGLKSIETDDVAKILNFYEANKYRGNIICQCQAGIGRSRAAQAAFIRASGGDNRAVLKMGTHNRRLYQQLCAAAGSPLAPDPLVSMVVRLKYRADRACAFAACMERQRYENWETIFVSDGPIFQNSDFAILRGLQEHGRYQFIETPEKKGLWGHPYRQLGIDMAAGEYVGLSNDDNYYVPGYLEQMIGELQSENADLVFCMAIHRYCGWNVTKPGNDLGCWIAKRELVQQCPWPGNHFTADQDHMRSLIEKSNKTIVLKKPLFIKN